MSIPVGIKQVFLSFLQSYFSTEHPIYVWNVDPKKTKIFIADRNIAAPAILEKNPCIILSRGSLSWGNVAIGQTMSMDSLKPGNIAAKKRSDLVRASITLQCTSSNGVEAENIADIIFNLIVGSKDIFRSHGIHQITSLSMGEEQFVRGDTVPRIVTVPVNITFVLQADVTTSTMDPYQILVFEGSQKLPQFDPYGFFVDKKDAYGFSVSGLCVVYTQPPSVMPKVNYTGAITLNHYENVIPSGIIDGVNRIFYLPEAVYTGYSNFDDVELQ